MMRNLLIVSMILACVAACGSNPRQQEPVVVKVPVVLNETLTNSDSQIERLDSLDLEIRKYMASSGFIGASLSIMKNDSLVYAKGYGLADTDTPMEAFNSFRLASVSKLVTAAGIMKLTEQGRLTLDDKVFGPYGILGDEDFNSVIKDPNYFKITVEHLLRHQGGFNSYAGDPMFSTRTLIIQNHLDTVPDFNALSRIYLKRRIAVPGTEHIYSNYGYLVLSKVIEKITGEDYENWTQENILRPAGCYDFHIARNYYEERHPRETRYFSHDDSPVQEYNNSGREVQRAYGGSDITGLSGGGAWVASTPELMRFVASIDGREGVPDILSSGSINEMTRYLGHEYYGLGWSDIAEDGTWTRTGTLAETTAIIKYYSDGECWIFVSNTGTFRGARQANITAGVLARLRNRFSASLPERDLFTSHP